MAEGDWLKPVNGERSCISDMEKERKKAGLLELYVILA
jgi:hypothetical protein